MGGKKKTFLSLGRRITLIQSCLLFIPSYFLSLYKISSSVATRIEKMQNDFLWSGLRREREIIRLVGSKCVSLRKKGWVSREHL